MKKRTLEHLILNLVDLGTFLSTPNSFFILTSLASFLLAFWRKSRISVIDLGYKYIQKMVSEMR